LAGKLGAKRHRPNQGAGVEDICKSLRCSSVQGSQRTIEPPRGVCRAAEIRFLTTQAAAWLASVNGGVTVNVEADLPGRASNLAAVNLITRLISDSPGEGTYTITASSITAGGSEEETDEELRARTRAYPLTLRRGTLDALEYGALQIASVRRATAVEDSGGIVTVYVSDIDGASTGATVTVSATVPDTRTMTHDVARELQEWRAAGSLVNVTGGLLQTVDIEVVLTVRAGADVLAITTQIETAIEGAVNRLRIGETLYKNTIATAARLVDPDNILECEVVAPATNTAPTGAGYIIRAGTITVS
jgi:uncharacterized phage protein gp47/JayE